MTSLARWISYLANLGVGLTGLALVWMVWLLAPEDPYAIVNHPAQPLWKSLHLWLAPILTLNIGYLWCQHAWSYWRGNVQNGRLTGIVLLATALPMILSGVGLQTAMSENARLFWSAGHTLSSLAWCAGIASHIWIHRRQAAGR